MSTNAKIYFKVRFIINSGPLISHINLYRLFQQELTTTKKLNIHQLCNLNFDLQFKYYRWFLTETPVVANVILTSLQHVYASHYGFIAKYMCTENLSEVRAIKLPCTLNDNLPHSCVDPATIIKAPCMYSGNHFRHK